MFEDTTYEVILHRMLDRVSAKFDKREGSVIWDTHSPAAIEFQILYLALDTIIQEAYGDTATREFLILRCRERGMTPYKATKAILKGEFSPADVDVLGKRFNIGEMNYLVTEQMAQGIYKVQCETEGEEGNRYLGTMIPIEYIRNLETAELTEVLIPGEEEEGTEELRKRYFESFVEKAFGGNVKDYLEKTNAIAGVGCTKVIRVWNGDIKPSQMIPSDAVKAWYGGIVDTLAEEPKNWLKAVYQAAKEKKLTTGGTVLLVILNSEFDLASKALLETVQKTMDPEAYAGEGYGLAPIGHVVSVKSAEGITITVRTGITFEQGYGWSNLQKSIEDVITAYFLELRRSWADTENLIIRVSQIETRILGIKGIIDIRGTTLNGVEENYTMGPYEIPVLGGVSA